MDKKSKRSPIKATKPGRKIPYVLLLALILIGAAVLLALFSRSRFAAQERATIVWVTNPVWVSSIHRESGIVSMVRLPAETYVPVPGGYGSYRIGVLWKLGKIEKKNGDILAAAVSSFLGAPVDEWVALADSPLKIDGTGREVLARLISRLAPHKLGNYPELGGGGLLDRLVVWWKLRSSKATDVISVNLDDEQVYISRDLPDGTTALIGDPELVDKVSQKLFWEDNVRGEKLVWRIFNSSEVQGLGNLAARLLTNMGLHIIGVENGEPRDRCLVSVPDHSLKSAGVKRITELLNCELKADPKLDREAMLYVVEESLQM